jgi:hypothetical protein
VDPEFRHRSGVRLSRAMHCRRNSFVEYYNYLASNNILYVTISAHMYRDGYKVVKGLRGRGATQFRRRALLTVQQGISSYCDEVLTTILVSVVRSPAQDK